MQEALCRISFIIPSVRLEAYHRPPGLSLKQPKSLVASSNVRLARGKQLGIACEIAG